MKNWTQKYINAIWTDDTCIKQLGDQRTILLFSSWSLIMLSVKLANSSKRFLLQGAYVAQRPGVFAFKSIPCHMSDLNFSSAWWQKYGMFVKVRYLSSRYSSYCSATIWLVKCSQHTMLKHHQCQCYVITLQWCWYDVVRHVEMLYQCQSNIITWCWYNVLHIKVIST